MPVSSIGAQTAAETAKAAAKPRLDTGSTVMGKDDFLKLLVTQLGNQDPLNPMDGQQFAAQLAQFSSVEQLLNISEGIASQQGLQELQAQSTSNSIATGLIGRNVEASGNKVSLRRPEDAVFTFDLPTAGQNVSVTVRDAAGQVVCTLPLDQKNAGRHEVAWDGEDAAGSRLPDGVYSFEVAGKDASGAPVQASARMRGLVERVSFGPEGALLWMNGISVPLSAVRSVEAATN